MSFNNLVGQALQGVPFQDRIQRYSFETTWSNGEVVQRGTGANYGEDAFLRPGFTYHTLVDYLFGRVLEHYEIGADTDAVLSRDWKIKLAASIVPRGLEIDGLFYESLIAQLEKTLRNKLEDEIKQSIGHRELTSGLAIAVSNEMVDITKHLKHPLAAVASERESSGVSAEHDRVVKKTGLLMKSVANALKHTIDYSVELREGNLRLSSELYNQPKPVDSVVDDFAVEAQNFANILAESAAYAAATIAFNQVDDTRFNIASAVLAVWNISISFSTMTNISRYRNRNEEARRKFFDEKMLNVMKAVFSLMTRSQRESFVRDENPFIIDLDHLVAAFVRNARYYNIAEAKILSFEQNYDVFRNSSNDQTSSVAFTRQLLQEFIPDTFHENSYLQENLVNIYKALDEMLALKKQAPSNGRAGADELYRMLLAFRPELSASIERGSIKYGFVRDHAWYRTPFPVTIQRLLSPLLCRRTISHKTYGILKAVEAMRAPDGIDKTLGRPVQDLTEHYHATNESGVGSMIFVSAFSVFCFSVFFTIFRIVGFASTAQWVHTVLMYAPWASIASTLGSTIAITEFTRKLRILFSLDAALGRSNMKSDPRIKRIRSVTRIQEFLTVVRLTIVVAASIALPWSVAEATFHSLGNNYSFAVSIVTAVAALSAAIVFFFVEFVVRYNLDPRLGRVVSCGHLTILTHTSRTFYFANPSVFFFVYRCVSLSRRGSKILRALTPRRIRLLKLRPR